MPGLSKIRQKHLQESFFSIMGEQIDLNTPYTDQGMDDLDSVSFIMEIEKRVNISISDDIVNELMWSNAATPMIFLNILSEHREKRLGLLDI